MTSLKRKSIIAVLWDFAGTFAAQGISFIISIFLARLLAPEEFGVVAMAMVFIAVFQTFADFGFSAALVQNKENSPVHYSSIFIINLFAGLILFGGFQVAAPLIGEFYENDTITELVRWLAFNFIFFSLSLVQIAILKRELRFKELNIRLVISSLVGGIVGILMAFSGYGVYALVAKALIAAFLNVIILWSVTTWRPNFEFSWPAVKSLTGFSFYIFLAGGTDVIIQRMNILIIGKLFSATTLGYFSLADNLNNIIAKFSSGSIGKVFFPAMSKLQGEPEQFKRTYLKVLSVVAFITFFLSGAMIISGEFIIITLFGEKWAPSILIFQILMLKIFNFPINSIIVNSFLAKGKANENFWYGNIRKLMRLIPFLIAYKYGFEPFLYSLVAVSLIATTFNLIISTVSNKIPLLDQLKSTYTFGLFFLIALIPSFFIVFNEQLIIEIILNGLLFSLIYFSLTFLLRKDFFELLKNVIIEK